MAKIPFGLLLPSRNKTDHAKQLKDLFTVIENEQDKEKRNYEDVRKIRKNFVLSNDFI